MSGTRVDYRDKNVRNVPPKVKQVVMNDALAHEMTMADAVGIILGQRYGVVYTPTGRRSQRPDAKGDQFMLSLPPEIVDSIAKESRERRITESSVILAVISDKYGLIYEPKKKGRVARG